MKRRAFSQRGFSLLEMIVALVILSLSLTVLYQATAGATRNVRSDERYSYAVLIAESLLAEHPVAAPGGVNRSGEVDDFQWGLRSQALPDNEEGNTVPVALHHLTAEVSWWDGGVQRRVNLETVVPEAVGE